MRGVRMVNSVWRIGPRRKARAPATPCHHDSPRGANRLSLEARVTTKVSRLLSLPPENPAGFPMVRFGTRMSAVPPAAIAQHFSSNDRPILLSLLASFSGTLNVANAVAPQPQQLRAFAAGHARLRIAQPELRAFPVGHVLRPQELRAIAA
jgi:hypothetical protein